MRTTEPVIVWPSTLVAHHSASPLRTTIDEIRAWHTDPNRPGGPFLEIGYHYVIHQDGDVRAGRPLPFAGAHARGANIRSIGVCLVGDNTREGEHWTQAEIHALRWLYTELRLFFVSLRLKGHRDMVDHSTACPGCDVEDLVFGGI